MSDQHIILGIHIGDRLKNAVDVQKVFTEYGCNIKTRIGLHDASESVCSPSGVVLIEFFGAEDEAEAMKAKLAAVEGVGVQSLVFEH